MKYTMIGNNEKNNLLNINDSNKYYDDSYVPDLNDMNDVHVLLSKYVDKNSVVLDLGCGSGIIGGILKKHYNCSVYGIELDESAYKIAKSTDNYKEIFCFDIQNKESSNYKSFFKKRIKYDYLICSDILEHLINPADVLYEFGKLLKPNGKCLISLPNIAHCDIIYGLLNDKFNYSKMGILDNTHLRFFTKTSFAQYIDSANKFYSYRYDLQIIDRTEAYPLSEDYPCFASYLKKYKSFSTLQNLFLLKKISKNKETVALKEILETNNPNILEKIEKQLKIANKIEKSCEDEELKRKLLLLSEENEKLKRDYDIICNNYNRVVSSRIWKYTKLLRNIKNNISNTEYMIRNINNKKPSILFVVHSWLNMSNKTSTGIGGTTIHVMELIKNIKKDYNCYVLTIVDEKYVLIRFNKDKQEIYDLGLKLKVVDFNEYDFDFLNLFTSLIDNLKIDIVHIHHIINFPCDLQFINDNIKVIMTLHDYSILCQRYFLIDNNNKICDKIEIKKCEKCVCSNKINLRNQSAQNLIKRCDDIIVPDITVIEKVRETFDINNYKVIPHGIDYDLYKTSEKREHSKKNIAFVGIITQAKGSDIIRELIDNNNDNNIIYHLFGYSTDEYLNKNHENYIFHGTYNRYDLPKILNDNDIDLILLLSKCPETYNFTLREVMIAKIPVISFNVGAIAHRVKESGIGWVIDFNSNSNDINLFYKIVFDETNYKEKMDNYLNYKENTIESMAMETEKIYKKSSIVKKKNMYHINKYIKKFQLIYKV